MTERDTILLVVASDRAVPEGLDEQVASRVRRVESESAAVAAVDDAAVVLVTSTADGSATGLVERLVASAPDTPVVAVVPERSDADGALFDAGVVGVVTPETVPRLVGPEGPELLEAVEARSPESRPGRTAGRTRVATAEDTPDGEPPEAAKTDRDGLLLDRDDSPAADLARYDTIVNTVEDAIYLMDADGRFVAVNDAAETLTGHSRDFLEGRHVSEVMPVEHVARGERLIRDLLADEDRHVGTMEQTVVDAEGEEIPCENRLAIVERDGEFVGSVGVVRDVRERRERERELREERALVEAIFEAVPDVLYAFDEAGEFLRWNDRVPEITGYDDDEIEDLDPLEFLAPADRERVSEALGTVVSDHCIEQVEADLETKGDDRIPHELSGGPVVDDDGELIGVAGMGRDVSDRVARERKIERQRDELDELNRINAVIRDIDQALIRAQSREEAERIVCDRLADSEAYRFATVARYDAATDTVVPHTGAGDHDRLDVSEALGTTASGPGREVIRTGSVQVVRNLRASDRLHAWESAAFECGVRSLASIPVAFEDTTYGLLSVYATRPDAFDEREETVLGELGETLGYALASIEREEREQLLTTLQGSTRELIDADTQSAVCERVVSAVSSVLETADVGTFLLDEGGDLRRIAATDDFADRFGPDRLPDPDHGDSVCWTAFLDGETVVFDGPDSRVPVDRDIRSGIAVPLGHHALLVALSENPTEFDGDLRRVLELFATSAEAALDRVEHEGDLRARDAELETQNSRLKRQVKINEVIRGVDEALVDGNTRREIETAVCERLVSEGSYRFAWIGQSDPATDGIEFRSWAGDGAEYLDSIGADATEPSRRALAADEPVVVTQVSADLHDEPWRQAALLRGFRSVVAVPLVYENYTYGVLTVYAEEGDAFGESERPVFAQLGGTIANAINGIETKQSLLGDEAVRLRLRIEDETCPLGSLSRQLDCEIELEGVNTWTADGLRAFLSFTGVDPQTVTETLEDAVSVADYRTVGDPDSRVYEVSFADTTVLGTLMDHGGLPRDLTVSDDGIELIVDVSRDIQVRELIDAVQATYPTTELIARKDVTRELRSSEQLRDDVLGDLTDRQREVLTTAHLSGYFERPRESTGQDIADALGVSQPAVNRHLRVVQRTVFDWLLSGTALDGGRLDS